MTRSSRSRRVAVRWILVFAATFVLASCAEDAPLDTLGEQLAGPEAQAIGSFMTWILWICYAVFAVVLGITLYSWRNFRIKTDDYEEAIGPSKFMATPLLSSHGRQLRPSF